MTDDIHRCWTEEAINRYFTTEAMAKDQEAFMEVHLPIDRIVVDRNYNAFQVLGGQEYTDENGLKEFILKSTPQQPNRVFSLIGETGSGKSELCQWLYYQIQDQRHIPILIRRSMTRLRDIVAEINQHLNEPVPSDMRDITDLWEETVSKQLTASMLMHLNKPDVFSRIGSQNAFVLRQLIDNRDFELRMRQNFVAYRDEIQLLDKPRDPNLLPEKQFAELVSEAGGLLAGTASICYFQLQRAIADCLKNNLQVEDLIDKLKRISLIFKKLEKRPVLLIEDITTFVFLQNDLLDYLFDLSSGNFDVIIGITTDFERTNEQQIYKAQQTIRERIEGRFVLTNERNETLFLRENYVRLACLYLTAIKDKHCPICRNKLNQAFGEDLYPFNERFLYNVYSNLQQDGNRKQTPRLYLKSLGQVLRSTLPPFEAIELTANVQPPTAWFAQGSASNDLAELLKWYGLNTNQGVFLAKQIVEVFGLTVPINLETVSDHFYRFGLRPGAGQSLPNPPAFITADKTKLTITNVEPREGLENSPNTLTIEVQNLQRGFSVRLGQHTLQWRLIAPTRLQAIVPANLPLGVHDLTITNPDNNRATFPNAYTVKEPAAPSIAQFQPTEGEANQPNEIFITGTNFQNRCVVTLGNIRLTTERLSATQLKASIPPDLTPGSYDLTVINPDGRKTVRTNAYAVKPEDLFGQLDQWLARQGNFPGRAKFKDGVWQLLDMFQFEPFILYHPHSITNRRNRLTYTRGERSSQIYLHNSADSLQAGYIKLTIQPKNEYRDLFSQVLSIGQGQCKVDDTLQLNHPLLYDWLNDCVNSLKKEMRSNLETALKMPLEQFIVMTKFLLLNNTTGLCEFRPEALAQPLLERESFKLNSMGDRPEKFAAWWSAVQSLFTTFFHFRDNIVNYPYLSQVMSQCDPVQTLVKLRSIDSREVYDAYSIGQAKDDYPLRVLANLVSSYARDLFAIQQNQQFTTTPTPDQLHAIADLLTTEINLEQLRTQLDKLRQLCQRVGITWQNQWNLNLHSLDRKDSQLDFETFAEQLREAITRLDKQRSHIDIFIFLSLQRQIHTLVNSAEYEVLQTIVKIDQSISNFLVHHDVTNLETDLRYKAFQQNFNLFLELAKQ